MRTRGIIGVAAVLLALLAAGPASAATFNVTTTGDPGPKGTTSLRQAITAAAAGDTVVVPAGHYTLTAGQITVGQAITITGAGPSRTIVDGNNASGIFALTNPGQVVTIANIAMTRGKTTATAARGGGAAVINEAAGATLTDDVFTDNAVTGSGENAVGGGAVYNDGGPVTITGSLFQGNSVTASGGNSNGGGAVFDTGAGITMTSTTVSGNSASISGATNGSGGGAYYEDGGGLTATNSSFIDNRVTVGSTGGLVGGGGLYDHAGGISLTNASVTGNSATVTGSAASVGGGGVFDDGSGETWVNVTLSDDTLSAPSGAKAGGGGLFLNAGPGKLTNTTIADNSSNQNSGAVLNTNAGATFKSSLIAGNSAANGHDCDTSGAPFTSLGYNIEAQTPTCGLSATGDVVGADPHLAAPANNGGPGPTNALLAGSPAIDHIPKADCTDQQSTPQPVTTDERGVPRGLDGFCDVGAYETAPADLRLTASAAPKKIVAGQRATVTFSISDSGPAPATNTKLTLGVPKGLKLVSVTPTPIGTVTSAGAQVTVTVQGTKAGKRSLTGTVSANEHDPTPADNTASVAITVSPLKVSKLKVRHRRVSFTLSIPAKVKLTLERCTTRRHCKKVGKSFKVSGHAGANHVKLKPRHLKAGRYKLIAVATVAGVKSQKAAVRFRIL